MGFPPETQNIGACIVLAGLGGVLEVIATAVVAVPDAKEKQGILVSERRIKASLLLNVLLQICASVAGNTMSTWFGPVSIVCPVFFASQMVANMVVYGFLTGLENFTKQMRVGTYVVVFGTVLIIVNGPQAQDNQDVNDLITKWYALLWSGILLTGMAVSSLFMALGVERYESEWPRAAILLVARGCAFSVNLTVSKPFAMKPGFPMILVWLGFKILSGAVYSIAIIIQSTSVTQSTFVPMNTTVTLLLNAITGIIIWEDWRTVNSWLGYICSFALLCLGAYLLLGDTDVLVFMSDNPRYGHKGKLKKLGKMQKMRGRRNLADGLSTPNITTVHSPKNGDDIEGGSDAEEKVQKPEMPSNEGGTVEEEKHSPTLSMPGFVQSIPMPRVKKTRKEAWVSVFKH